MTNQNSKKLTCILAVSVFVLFAQSAAMAAPRLIPGFMFVGSPYIGQPNPETNEANVNFSIQNMNPTEPLVLLDITGDSFEDATVLEQVVINPGESVSGIQAVLNGVDSTIVDSEQLELTLHVRFGLEAMEYVDAIVIEGNGTGAGLGLKGREAGIPNEYEFMVNFDIGD